MSDRRFYLVAILLSAAFSAVILVYLRTQDAALVTLPESAPPDVQPRREIPKLARVLRALKLVTVEIDTGVSSESANHSWRGDVLATVVAPARFYYGVDLSQLTPDDVSRNPLTGALTLRVPPPRRIAVEVYSSDEHTRVRVGGLRLRDVAGEYHLGLARAALDARARAMTLSIEDQERLRTITREQIIALVRAVTDDAEQVHVEFLSPTEHADGTSSPASSAGTP